ncbi:MAG: DNA cytosine methyltransferase [Planctomycetales bacterium]|nr:DNA cytosine methyltransferase [Planctomycetales bacterium]
MHSMLQEGKEMKFKAMDVFAGCGGLTTGLIKAGFNVVGAIEFNPAACEAYRLNHKDTKLWMIDIASLSVTRILDDLKLEKGELGLLAGCPPCQGFSTVRTLNGSRKISDERNDLIFEFLRLVKGLLPRTVMMENVPGLADDDRIAGFQRSLRGLGYTVRFKIVDVADYSVPQRRHRVVLLAGRSGPIEFARPAKRRRTVRQTIGRLPPAGDSGDAVHDFPENRMERIRQLIAMVPKDGGSRADLPKEFRLKCHEKCDGFKDVYGRMAWDDVAPTLTTGVFNPSKGRFLHPEANRTVTIREAAMLQTFPRRYKFPVELGKVALAMQIGNAIPPEFVRRHAIEVRKYLENEDG